MCSKERQCREKHRKQRRNEEETDEDVPEK
jgi:hypothetical protein